MASDISRDISLNSMSSLDLDSEVYKHEIFKNEHAGVGTSNTMATNSSMYSPFSRLHRAWKD